MRNWTVGWRDYKELVEPVLCEDAVVVSSVDRVAPVFLMLVTSSSFSPFMVMSALVFYMLLGMIFDFSALTFIPHFVIRFWSGIVLKETGVWCKRVFIEIAPVFSSSIQDSITLGLEVSFIECSNTGIGLTSLHEGLRMM
ncbi:hypothetical protein DPMN_163992 [Dreissena polymorpha]|uniref:Uncharacterized protein n=1 Tax=Dreissena polymorpha TaxID=45954 RepID=A0A9D4EXT9_DREPO|nr:hypothetical protein DPMN_163948 [Dreissena polymorpha]KAH3785897.1 hypothetical protein DPMN_163992 [Dreissena polymorpha]